MRDTLPLVDNFFNGKRFQKFGIENEETGETTFSFLVDGVPCERGEWTRQREAAIAVDLAQAQDKGRT